MSILSVSGPVDVGHWSVATLVRVSKQERGP
jgi:hypothetical protein